MYYHTVTIMAVFVQQKCPGLWGTGLGAEVSVSLVDHTVAIAELGGLGFFQVSLADR